ncbi:hypothetical protein SAMN04489726_1953 [Allokutzneria albata]|uniref:Uncharacterized protein n=1 Tax=Allokutzneria albata TaxID=211114 RepID=A0A1G9TRR8_ALLAB|nr:hypothetical protein SAMN04489726_1953 [Allokutzneria albata]
MRTPAGQDLREVVAGGAWRRVLTDPVTGQCRHHHRMKHESNCTCENLPAVGRFWTTPRGRGYETELEPIAEPAPL